MSIPLAIGQQKTNMDNIIANGSPEPLIKTETVTADGQAATPKYGALRLARYLIRNFVDCIDVCETINRQVQDRVEPSDIEQVFREIECMAMAVPNTVSSVIIGFSIPSRILEDRKLLIKPRPLQVDYSISPKPAVHKGDRAVIIAHDVKNLFDLQALSYHLRNAGELKAAGLEPETMKNAVKLTVKKKDGVDANFVLILTCVVTTSAAGANDGQ